MTTCPTAPRRGSRSSAGERPEGDHLAEAFFHLARVEERNGARDEHDRFRAASSCLDPLDPPLERLRAQLGVEPPRWGGARFAVALTHDVDVPWKWTRLGVKGAAARAKTDLTNGRVRPGLRELRGLAGATVHKVRGTDPYWSFDRILEDERRSGASSTFFLLADHAHEFDGAAAEAYERLRPRLVETLQEGKAEVGLHGSYSAADDAQRIADEKERLERLSGPVQGQRYHYLRIDPHRNLGALEAAGFAYDSSLGFGDAVGFRAGIAHPFRPWDFERDAPHDLIEVPLAAMDVTLSAERYLNLSVEQAGKRLSALLDWAEKNGGGFAILWHSEQYDSALLPGWDVLYRRLLEEVRARGGSMPPGRGPRGGGSRVAVVTQPMRIYRVGAGRLGSSALFLALVLAAPAALVLGRALPAHGLGLILRLTAASACVLIVPGAVFVRALGRPHTFGVAIAASFAWSLAALAGALALTFAFGETITTTLWLVAAFSAVSLVPALMRAPVPSEESERLTIAGVAAAATLFAGAVWWASNTVYGDALFHLGRVRKLESFHLTSLSVVDEFRHGGLHPGYAFPVWHAGLAMVARLADVDPTVVMLHLPAILTPLAVVLAYAAGAALFRSYGAGVATAAAQVGLIGFSRAGTGSFDFLALPPTVARALIAPALLALVFSLVAGGRRRQVLSISAASIALALVHPTYAFFAAVPLAGLPARAGRPRVVALAREPAHRGVVAGGAHPRRPLRALVEADRRRDGHAQAGCRRAGAADRPLQGPDRRRPRAAPPRPGDDLARRRDRRRRPRRDPDGRARGNPALGRVRARRVARRPRSSSSSRGRSTACRTRSRSRRRGASRSSSRSRSRSPERLPSSAATGSPAAWPRSAPAACSSSSTRGSSRTSSSSAARPGRYGSRSRERASG